MFQKGLFKEKQTKKNPKTQLAKPLLLVSKAETIRADSSHLL